MISTSAPELRICANESAIVRNVIEQVNQKIIQQLKEENSFHLALTGGSLGLRISSELVATWNEDPEKYSGLHVWWGDERFVPEMSSERNALPVLTGLDQDSPIHVHQVLPSDSNVDLDVSARRYNADLFGIHMNLTILGLGPDGHVASLFPGKWEEAEERNAIAIHDSPKAPPLRVSFSMAQINSSESVWFVVSGDEKHEAVAKIIARDRSIPASYVHGRTQTLLFTDHSPTAPE